MIRCKLLSIVFIAFLFSTIVQAETKKPIILSPGVPLIVSEDGCAPMFPFVISKVPLENVTNAGTWDGAERKPAWEHGFMRIENGQFVNDDGIQYLFGTNISCGANFPESKTDAEFLARSMARFGINVVRLHFTDTRGYFFDWNSRDMRTILPERRDAFDYLVYQLEKNGIYVNLNLHVARQLGEKEGFPESENQRPRYDKGVDNFMPRMIELQKEYARDFLTHVNPYTGRAYVNDPGIAMIEINNENSIVNQWRSGERFVLPPRFAMELQKQWNVWLKAKYHDTKTLHKAWKCRNIPTSENLLLNGDFSLSQPATEEETVRGEQRLESWQFQRETATWRCGLTPERTLEVHVIKDADASWAPQFQAINVLLEEGMPYTLTIKMRGKNVTKETEKISVGVTLMDSPWSNLGMYQSITLTDEWQEYSYSFKAKGSSDRARIAFGNLKAGSHCEIASVSLKKGGYFGAKPDQKLEDGTLEIVNCYAVNTTQEQYTDMIRFLVELEGRYFNEMYHYVHNDLKARVPVSGTQLNYGSWFNQATLDYCDIHSYWNHPSWLDKSWDMNNWYVKNLPLVNFWSLENGTSNRLANARVLGIPLTVSEYQHPFPNFYGAECLPTVCALGAFQDWSGIFHYTWQHNTEYDQQQINGYFDVTCHQVQLAHYLACAALFRRDITRGPSRFIYAPEFTPEDEIIGFSTMPGQRDFTKMHSALPLVVNAGRILKTLKSEKDSGKISHVGSRGWKVPEGVKVITSWENLPKEFGSPEKRWFRNENGELYFNNELDGKGYFTVNTPKTKIFTGFVAGRSFQIGDVTLTPGKTRLDWCTFSMTTADAHRTLIAVTGHFRNTDMVFEDLGDDRITCRADWGKAPALCEGVPMNVKITGGSIKWKCYALTSDGSRHKEVPIHKTEDGITFTLSPDYQTIWYELVR